MKKNIYIVLTEILLLLYIVFYCIYRDAIILIPICIIGFGVLFILAQKANRKVEMVKLFYVCFCVHIIANDYYLILDENSNKWIFLVCTILMLKFCDWSYVGNNKKSMLARFFVDIIITCQCFGYRCFVIADCIDVKIAVCLFCLLFFWGHALSDAVLKIFSYLSGRIKSNSEEETLRGYTWIILFSIVCGVGLLFSLAFYPGIITPDNIYFYESALNSSLYGASDIHSFAYLCVFKIIISIYNNYYIITFLLMVLFAAAWASVFTYLCSKGLRKKVALLITIGWLLFPSNIYMLIASWKDVPFTICLLVLSFQLLKNYFDCDYADKISNLLVLSLALFGVAVFRSNGQVVLLCVVVFGIIGFIKKNIRFKMLASILVSLIAVIIFKGPIFNYFNVQQSPSNYSALPFMDGIVEYVYQGNELDDETEKYFYSLTTYDDCMEYYGMSDFSERVFEGGYENFDLKKATIGYFRCLVKNPMATISARFKRTFNMWSLFYYDEFRITKSIVKEIQTNDYGWQYIENMKFLRDIIIKLYSEKHLIGMIQSILYRGGFNILLWMCSFLYLPIKKRKLTYALVPVIANTVGLLVGCCFSDYRYIYPMFVITVPYISAVLIDVEPIKD
ncbi:MAG: hypothetical protein HDR19_03715 [Lachnospiraceae bacterium]|nr:hypothetical protein [Lachnospiraceae bacterium]